MRRRSGIVVCVKLVESITAGAGRRRRATLRACAALGATASVLAAAPAPAGAHGPVAPVATSYLARIRAVPTGLEAKVVDGYVRIWLKVPTRDTVVVLDYSRAPYLRFTPAGVEVNHNSSMYYLNQTPVAETPPGDLRASMPPDWQLVTAGHDYEWHDGRLQALAGVALLPGASYVGGWRIPLLLDGHPAAISGGLWHGARPSIVWFWPIAVLIGCVLAAWRLHRPELDRAIARALAATAIVGLSLAAAARGLHGRPDVPVGQLVELAVVLAFGAWALHRVLADRPGYLGYFAIAFVALWEGFNTAGALLNHFVLLALPAPVSRIAAVLCLGAGAGILLLVFRLAEPPRRSRAS
jgi:hypothetical protein